MTTSPSQVRDLLDDVADTRELLERQTATRLDLRKYAPRPGQSVQAQVGLIVRYAQEILHVPVVTAQQESILRLYVEHRLGCCRSAPGLGKTFAAAVVALYHTYVIRGMVVALAASQRQVTELLFGEIRKLWHGSGLAGELFQSALRVNEAAGQVIIGFTSSDSSRVRGFHHSFLLILVDESQGLPDFVWDGVLLMATGENNRVLAIGNAAPRPVGRWYSMHRGEGLWHPLRLSARDHPNILEGREVIAGGPSVEWMKTVPPALWPLVIDAETPETDTGESLVTRADLDRAAALFAAGTLDVEGHRAPVTAGLDPARFGADQTVLALVRGPTLLEMIGWEKLDLMSTAQRAVDELVTRGYRVGPRLPAADDRFTFPRPSARLIVDEIGIGSGALDRLTQLGANATGFNSSLPPALPKDAERFANRRSQGYWRIREALERGQLALPPDELLFEELLATTWSLNTSGKIQLSPKDQIRVDLGRSPDRADALVMALGADLGVPQVKILTARWG